MNVASIERIVETARNDGRSVLLEPEGYEILEALGIGSPHRLVVRDSGEVTAAALAELGSERVVIKAISPRILHKRDAGALRVVDAGERDVCEAVDAMARALADHDVRGFSIHELVSYSRALGSELLLSLRWSREFGPLIGCGLGGDHAELLAESVRPDRGLALAAPGLGGAESWRRSLDESLLGRVLRREPEAPARFGPDPVEAYALLAAAAGALPPDLIAEIEINPLISTDGTPVALDVLITLPEAIAEVAPERPLPKLHNLLHPRTIAIVGVSRRANPGRVILDNILSQGFDAERLYLVRPDQESLEGCRSVPDLASLPDRVDLLIVAVGAQKARALVTEAIALDCAESLIVIAGGLGEKRGSEGLADDLRGRLAHARRSPGRGPVINGGNCLGVRSIPGRYDSLFIPRYKLSAPADEDSNVALISQSGALMVAKMSRLEGVGFRYCISVGNQLDLTLGDYLTFLKDDTALELFAVYAEGFRPLDGRRFLEAARQIRERGGVVVLYRAGRTRAGSRAAATHTAAVAGSYPVTRALAHQAGIVVADTLDDFEDLIRLFGCLPARRAGGRRLGVISNAGFECVAAPDRLGGLELAELAPTTRSRLEALLHDGGLEGVVGVGNPLDVTPILGDGAFVEAARAVLEDETVDVGIVGCVPLTPALETLEPGRDHRENVSTEDGVACGLIRLSQQIDKPWVAVVDGGPAYDRLVELLNGGGVPTLRTMDRAARLLGVYCG